jgi:hypothetical protein
LPKRKLYAIFLDYIKAFDLLAIVSVIRNIPDCGGDERYVTKNTLTVSHVRIRYNRNQTNKRTGFFKAIS